LQRIPDLLLSFLNSWKSYCESGPQHPSHKSYDTSILLIVNTKCLLRTCLLSKHLATSKIS
jgi:hypothetical protein